MKIKPHQYLHYAYAAKRIRRCVSSIDIDWALYIGDEVGTMFSKRFKKYG